MSNQIQTAVLLDAIRSAVIAAWPTMPICYGSPRLPLTAPYCVVQATDIGISLSGRVATVGNTSQVNRFSILGRFPFPSDASQVILLQKVSFANDLIAQLQAAGTFAGGVYPLVTSVDFSEADDPNEKVFEGVLGFSVETQASHH